MRQAQIRAFPACPVPFKYHKQTRTPASAVLKWRDVEAVWQTLDDQTKLDVYNEAYGLDRTLEDVNFNERFDDE
jgi:hypothetical protein